MSRLLFPLLAILPACDGGDDGGADDTDATAAEFAGVWEVVKDFQNDSSCSSRGDDVFVITYYLKLEESGDTLTVTTCRSATDCNPVPDYSLAPSANGWKKETAPNGEVYEQDGTPQACYVNSERTIATINGEGKLELVTKIYQEYNASITAELACQEYIAGWQGSEDACVAMNTTIAQK